MTKKLTILLALALLLATPARPFWGAFFAGIGQAVGSAFGIPTGGPGIAGLMPVSVRAAPPVLEAAQRRLQELQDLKSLATNTLDHYAGIAGTLRDLGSLTRYRAAATDWLLSSSADQFGTSGGWTRVLNGQTPRTGAVTAYEQASAPVPNWSAAMPSLPPPLQTSVRQEHATVELADAASVRSMAVLGEMRRLAPQRRLAHAQLEQVVLDPRNGSQAVPALLGKVSVGQVHQLRETEQTNQLLDALLEAELAGLKRERDRLARSMNAASEYQAMAANQPTPQWRMP